MVRAKYAAALAVISSLMLTGAAAPANALAKANCPRVEIKSPSSTDALVPPGGITRAAVGVTEGQTVLNLSLTPSAAEKVRSYTADPTGKQIVMLVDNRLFKSVMVRDPIKGQGIMIGPVDRAAAEVLAARINGCANR